MIEYELEKLEDSNQEKSKKNYLSILKEKVSNINKFYKRQTNILESYFNKFKWISGLAIFSTLFPIIYNSTGKQADFFLSLFLSGFFSLMLTPILLMAVIFILYVIVVPMKNDTIEDIIRYFSKDYKDTQDSAQEIELELYQLLSDPLMQHEVITYLQTLQSVGYEKFVAADLDNLIRLLSQKDYYAASTFITKNLSSWIIFEKEHLEKNTIDNSKKEFLKQLSIYVNKEESKKDNYDLKSML